MPGTTEQMCVLAHAECCCGLEEPGVISVCACVFKKASVVFVFIHGEDGGDLSVWY